MAVNFDLMLRDNEEHLPNLGKSNPLKLSKKMFQQFILTDCEEYDLFKSLDHSRVEPQLQVRYLLRLVSMSVREDESVWKKFMTLLANMGETQMYDYLSDLTSDTDIWYDCQSEFSSIDNTEECPIEVSCLDTPLSSEDIHWILDILKERRHRWEQFAIALKLTIAETEDCRRRGDNMVSLNNVLYCWHAKDAHVATVNTLIMALRSVSENLVAQYLLDEHVLKKQSNTTYKPKTPHSTFFLIKQSEDLEVADGKSTLLQVQTSRRESVCYQWKKDGRPLANSSTYCGANEDILVISHASQGTEGEYTCCVSCRGSEKCSNKITLTVLYPPVKKRLLDLYSIRREVAPDSWPPVGTKSFINLTVVQSDSGHVHDTISAIGAKSDKVINKRVKVDYTAVFGKCISRALIVAEGRPGSGKTTLVHKIVKDWSKGIALKRAKFVFIVTLRIVNRKTGQETLSSILKSLRLSEKELGKVCDEIEEANGEGVCFIIDGLDEYHPQDRDDSLIYQLLDKTFLPLAMIIVTSRPVAIISLRKEVITRKVEVLGFTKEQIVEYVHSFPFTSSSCDSGIATSYPTKLKDYLHSNPNVFKMCELPVHAALVCYLFNYQEGNIPSTQTNIYQEFTRCIILRHLRRHDSKAHIHSLKELRGSTKIHFVMICYLAYSMSIDRKQLVSKESVGEELLELFDSNSDEWCQGLVTINHIAELSGITETYSFLHLTLQEFLTAYYLACLETADIFSCCEDVSKQTCIFYFGLFSFDHNQNELKLDCLDHFRSTTLIHCALESQQQIVVDAVGSRSHGIYVFDSPTPSDLYALSYVIRNTSHTVTEISLINCDGNDECDYADFLTSISKHDFSSLKFLTIMPRLNNTATLALSRILNSCSSLIRASLSFHEISHDSAMAIVNISKHLTSLHGLSIEFWSPSGGITTLLRGWSNITNLSVCALFEDMDSSGVVEIGNALQPIIGLIGLDLTHCNIDDNAASALANGIRSCGAIINMSITYSTISHSGIITLLNEVHCLTKLTDLKLFHCNIGCDGATALANQLQYLTQLSRLELSNNNIGSVGVISLANTLHHLTKLSSLNLSCNSLNLSSAIAVITATKYLSSLRLINLGINSSIWFYRRGIHVQGILSPKDEAAYADLLAATRQHKEPIELHLCD